MEKNYKPFKTLFTGTGTFLCHQSGQVTQTGGIPVSRPAEYVLAQLLAGSVKENLKVRPRA